MGSKSLAKTQALFIIEQVAMHKSSLLLKLFFNTHNYYNYLQR